MLRGVVVVFFSVDYLLLCDGVSLKLSQSPQHEDRLADENEFALSARRWLEREASLI